MDANDNHRREGDVQTEQQQDPTDSSSQKPQEIIPRQSISSISSLGNKGSAHETDADDQLSSDMDGAGDAYRRRRAQLMAGLEAGKAAGDKQRRKHSRRQHRNGIKAPDDKHLAYSSDDEHGSDFSSMTTSDDVELSHLASDDALTDDEETGLTKKDKEHRKRKRRRNARLDGKVAGNSKILKQGNKDADKNVMKAMFINVLLIASWYLFSLSISIVCYSMLQKTIIYGY